MKPVAGLLLPGPLEERPATTPQRIEDWVASPIRMPGATGAWSSTSKTARASGSSCSGTTTRNATTILKREPATIVELEFGIALAKAKSLRDELEHMISEDLSEKKWQEFLRGNPFVLSMVFGRPIIKVGDQASVGGKTISGTGDRIADFLVRNSLTNNAALVEIKTPKSKLLNQSPYRRSVFAPAGELVGAINQALDQKSKFEQDIATIRYRNPGIAVEAHHVHACVLIGVLPSGDDRVRSFELFRHNLKDVLVVTYDELLRKVTVGGLGARPAVERKPETGRGVAAVARRVA